MDKGADLPREWPDVAAGVDLAARPERTAVCVLRREGARVVVRDLRLGCDDDLVLGLSEEAGKIGIDSPFGWPVTFVETVTDWNRSGRWPGGLEATAASLQLRRTDVVVRERTGRRPLSVSTDRIGVVAFRAARLLSLFEAAGHEIDRTGVRGIVAETYPAAALETWGMPSSGYKTDRQKLDRLLGEFMARCPWLEVSPTDQAAIRKSHDAFDCIVAAVLACQTTVGATIPPTPADAGVASIEGWIHIPSSQDIAGPER